jgi:hypothetical protein
VDSYKIVIFNHWSVKSHNIYVAFSTAMKTVSCWALRDTAITVRARIVMPRSDHLTKNLFDIPTGEETLFKLVSWFS